MTNDQSPAPLTRLEILDAIEQVFATPPVTTSEILATAEESGARAELLAALRQLPERRFDNVRDLWNYLSDIPVDT